jgi:hypothetical protein
MEISSLNWQWIMTFFELFLVGGIFLVLLNFHKRLKKWEDKNPE